jgi:hypothetical protein
MIVWGEERKKNLLPEAEGQWLLQWKIFDVCILSLPVFLSWIEDEKRRLENKLLTNMKKGWKYRGINWMNIHVLKEKMIVNYPKTFMNAEIEVIMIVLRENISKVEWESSWNLIVKVVTMFFFLWMSIVAVLIVREETEKGPRNNKCRLVNSIKRSADIDCCESCITKEI